MGDAHREPTRIQGCAGGNVRRKRKTRYTWLPIVPGFEWTDKGNSCVNRFILDIPTDGSVIAGAVPVLEDQPQDPGTAEGIGEQVGNEYLLKRIVGKLFLSTTYAATTTPEQKNYRPIIVTAGFFVARADPTNFSGPIGAAEGPGLYSPLEANLTRQPWIWRRSWMLGPGGFNFNGVNPVDQVVPQGLDGQLSWPLNNYTGSVLDGPHIDAKTARRIRLEERLWFGIAAASASTIGFTDVAAFVNVDLEARYLGAMRRPRGRSNFA